MSTAIDDISKYTVRVFDGANASRMYRDPEDAKEDPPRPFVLRIEIANKECKGREEATLQARDHRTLIRWCKALGVFATNTTVKQRIPLGEVIDVGPSIPPDTTPRADDATAIAAATEAEAKRKRAAAAAAERRRREQLLEYDRAKQIQLLREMAPLATITADLTSTRIVGHKSERIVPSRRQKHDSPLIRGIDVETSVPVDPPLLASRPSYDGNSRTKSASDGNGNGSTRIRPYAHDPAVVRAALAAARRRRRDFETKISRDSPEVSLVRFQDRFDGDDLEPLHDTDVQSNRTSSSSSTPAIGRVTSRGNRRSFEERFRTASFERPATGYEALIKQRRGPIAFGDIDEVEGKDASTDDDAFEVGQIVAIDGLRRNVEYNGRKGRVTKYVKKDNLYVVHLFATGKSFAEELVLNPMNMFACHDDDNDEEEEDGSGRGHGHRSIRGRGQGPKLPQRERPAIDRGYGIKKMNSLEWLRRLRLVRKTLDARVYGHAHMAV